ncbi:MAG: HEAT repeat domain-containing protein [Planctomycetota bacterium]
MTGILRITILLLLVAGVAAAQNPRFRPGKKKGKDGVEMEKPDRPAGPKKGAEPGKTEPEAPEDTFEAALLKLAGWPSTDAREAAATLALEGPEVEAKLIARLGSSTPALTEGIAFVLGEIGGDASVPALQAVASRPTMADHLAEVFTALGKLAPETGIQRIMPFLRHPKRTARLAAEHWLGSHVNATHASRLEAFFDEKASGPRVSAFRLLVKVAPDRALVHAEELLGDEAWELSRQASRLLADRANDEILADLNLTAQGPEGRRSAYAVLALVRAAKTRGNDVFTEETIRMLLDSPRGFKSAEKLNRGAAAIALAEIGHDSDHPEIDALLDGEVIDVLLDTLGGKTFYKDFPALAEPARDRFGLLTGIIERRSVPELWRWWHENRDGFVARRALREIDPDHLKVLRIRASSGVEPALTMTLFSTEAADALRPENTGIVFVHLLRPEALRLAELLTAKFLPLPDSGIVDPTRVMDGASRAGLGPEVVVTADVNGRSRTAAGRKGNVAPALLELISEFRKVRDAYAWQRYWDRDTYERFEDFLRREGEFFAVNPEPAAAAARLKGLILGSLDDLTTSTQRTRALDLLATLEADLSDSDCYRLALFLGREEGLTPFSERVARLLAGAGRGIVLPLLTEWAERASGTREIDFLADALVTLGKREIDRGAKSERVVVRRAAMRAAVRGLESDAAVPVLTVGTSDKAVEVRREALRGLGATGAESAVAVLKTAMDDPVVEIRNTAVEALGELKRPEVVPILTKELDGDDPGRRIAAVRALAASGLDSALSPVLLALKSDSSPVVRDVASSEIVKFGKRAMKGLSRIALSMKSDPAIRVDAIEAMSGIGGPSVMGMLTALLSDPAPKVADAAALSLAGKGRREAVPHLLDALAAGRSRSRIVGALERMSCQSFPRAKQSELVAIYRGWWEEHQGQSTGRWFADALERKGYGSPMMPTLARGEPDDRITPLLIGALADPDWFIRANANLWLVRMHEREFGEVGRFTSADEVRSVLDRWQEWWESR